MKNEIMEVRGTKWLVREAVSQQAALDEIAMATVRGSVGGKTVVDDTACGGSVRVVSDVERIYENS